MSNAVFPTLAGRGWSRFRSPIFKTLVHEAVNGKEVRLAQQAYPRWKYSFTYEVLRHDSLHAELQQLVGFFCSRLGSFDSFLYLDPNDCNVVNQALATMNVNGISTYQYQLIRSYGGFTEPVQVPEVVSLEVKANGAGSWTLANGGLLSADQNSGVITFNPAVAPASGAALTWSGYYYWRCRFMQDMLDFEEFLKYLWLLKKCEIITDKQ